MKRRKAIGLMLSGLAGLGLGCGKAVEELDRSAKPHKVRLSFPHVLNQTHPVHKAIEHFASEVYYRSKGEIEIRVYTGETIGSERIIADEVAKGNYDLTKISSAIMTDRSELAILYSLPYLFRSQEHMWQVLDGPIGRELLDMLDESGLKGLCYYDAGFRSFYTTRKPIEQPADLTGLRIRVQNSSIMQTLVASFGAKAIPESFERVYAGLKGGTFDGAENNIPTYFTENHYRAAPHYAFDEHAATPDMMLISSATWKRLSSAHQALLLQTAASSSKYQRGLWNQAHKEEMTALQAANVQFTHPDKAAFMAKTEPIYDSFKGTRLMEYVERIRAVQ